MSRAPTVDEVVVGYMHGLFPMAIDGTIGLYTADPRAIIPIDGFRIPRSVRRALRATKFTSRINTQFEQVVAACGGHRADGVWLDDPLQQLYLQLHEMGIAHSVEVWQDDALVGGLFGVAMGRLFTAESMFHRAPDAGNAALVACHNHLVRLGVTLWDIQMTSPHTARFGAVEIDADEYLRRLERAIEW